MNLVKFPPAGYCGDNNDIAAYLRSIADDIERGELGDLRNVVVIEETKEGTLNRHIIGQPCDHARFIGLLTCTIHRSEAGSLP